MSLTFTGYKLEIDLWEMLAQLTGEQRAQLIDALACQQEVIDEVVNQVLDGFTTLGSHGSTGYGGDPECAHGIDGARMRIAKASSEVAAKEIERLAATMERLNGRINEGWNAYHELLNRRYNTTGEPYERTL